jgi:hypothetical protein
VNIEIQNLVEEQTQPEVVVVAFPQKNLELISVITDAVRARIHQGVISRTPNPISHSYHHHLPVVHHTPQ